MTLPAMQGITLQELTGALMAACRKQKATMLRAAHQARTPAFAATEYAILVKPPPIVLLIVLKQTFQQVMGSASGLRQQALTVSATTMALAITMKTRRAVPLTARALQAEAVPAAMLTAGAVEPKQFLLARRTAMVLWEALVTMTGFVSQPKTTPAARMIA